MLLFGSVGSPSETNGCRGCARCMLKHSRMRFLLAESEVFSMVRTAVAPQIKITSMAKISHAIVAMPPSPTETACSPCIRSRLPAAASSMKVWMAFEMRCRNGLSSAAVVFPAASSFAACGVSCERTPPCSAAASIANAVLGAGVGAGAPRSSHAAREPSLSYEPPMDDLMKDSPGSSNSRRAALDRRDTLTDPCTRLGALDVDAWSPFAGHVSTLSTTCSSRASRPNTTKCPSCGKCLALLGASLRDWQVGCFPLAGIAPAKGSDWSGSGRAEMDMKTAVNE
mmetsp:Transcript_7781/g.17071  ORF Transcript_7781/g.17071 Transcript_7781/m.17071 type:complete len:283 (-) Transcript_7781:50-898(-)